MHSCTPLQLSAAGASESATAQHALTSVLKLLKIRQILVERDGEFLPPPSWSAGPLLAGAVPARLACPWCLLGMCLPVRPIGRWSLGSPGPGLCSCLLRRLQPEPMALLILGLGFRAVPLQLIVSTALGMELVSREKSRCSIKAVKAACVQTGHQGSSYRDWPTRKPGCAPAYDYAPPNALTTGTCAWCALIHARAYIWGLCWVQELRLYT